MIFHIERECVSSKEQHDEQNQEPAISPKFFIDRNNAQINMSYTISPTKSPYGQIPPSRKSPLRQVSNASANSSLYSAYTDPFAPSRSGTISSAASSAYDPVVVSKLNGTRVSPHRHSHSQSVDSGPSTTYKNVRESLRPLPQPPTARPIAHKASTYSPTSISSNPEDVHDWYDGTSTETHSSGNNYGSSNRPGHLRAISSPPEPNPHHTTSPTATTIRGVHSHHDNVGVRPPSYIQPNLEELRESSTGYLKTLSKLSRENPDETFSITAPLPSVAGLQGRRQLKRGDSVRKSKSGGARPPIGSEWSGRNWMDQQRKFLQAYEYLCHIGEAKEWIEDIIQKSIPPIVQLEEALRNGVTLAEVVQALQPEKHIKIFHNPKLQFRHSDNIAAFFRFLEKVELPDLFRFELVDLYDKKSIPKVIYCIHALSYLLYKNGMVDFRIGNLVGQLQFEHHELEETQRGLEKAGISMPNFSGMGANFGAEPEPEPVETEQERIEREIREHEQAVLELQSQIRGCLVRLRLGDKMQQLWDAEHSLISLQSILRGGWSRQIFEYRLGMKRFAVNLQSAARGFIVRNGNVRKEAIWRSLAPQVIKLQSIQRARRAREATSLLKLHIKKEESGIRNFQAAIRGALARKQVDDQYHEVTVTQDHLPYLQAAIRGMLQRHRHQEQTAHLKQSQRSTTALQAAVRAMLTRKEQGSIQQVLFRNTPILRAMQAVACGASQRNRVYKTKQELASHKPAITHLQAFARASLARVKVQDILASLQATNQEVLQLQAASRGLCLRTRLALIRICLQRDTPTIIQLQAKVRAFLFRKHNTEFLGHLAVNSQETAHLQALIRAMMVRLDIGCLLAELDEHEVAVENLQPQIRGVLVRAKFAEKQRFFKQNMEKVIKVQSFVRAKIQGEAYKSLTSGKNPPVGVVKNFVHLLNDSDFDFDEEIEFERMRKVVVQSARQNENIDQYIQQLDIKIALLVKNKITLDEVLKHQKHFGVSGGALRHSGSISHRDGFDLKALNKNSRNKLEHYQELFFLLQTQPQYLARLFKRIREQATPEKDMKQMRNLMMGVFGFAQKRREEYYLIKVLTRSIKEEVDECHSVQDYLRASFFWQRIFGQYAKSPHDQTYLKKMLGPVVKAVVDNETVDLESDPVVIYHTILQNEQLRTGQTGHRKRDVTREEAIRDPTTKQVFVDNLQDLRDFSSDLLAGLETMLNKMPYGIRYIAQQMFHNLCTRFQHDEQGYLLQVTGQWLWKHYLLPALLEPERFGVVDRGLAPMQKKNLAEIAKVINQVVSGRLFGDENIFLQPLNSFVGDAVEQLSGIWNQRKYVPRHGSKADILKVIDVPDAEAQFDIDEFNDLYAKVKPTLYIKMTDVFATHRLIADNVEYIVPGEDVLRTVIRELGSAKNNESDMMSYSNAEICLTLNPKLHNAEGKDDHLV